jgi:hypothetical protein
MRRLATLTLLLALAPGACAAPGPTPSGSPAAAPAGTAPSTSSSAPSNSAGGPADAGCPQGVQSGTVTLTEADQGRTVCVATGTDVEVYLRAPRAGQQWSEPVPDRTILQPHASGKGALQMGVTAGFYRAVAPGQARITAQLAPCRGPKPGPECDAIQLFEVTVVIR